ncbi:MAG: class I SAM-dependent methyltransferase [Candidatus Binataceae bacterium]
MDLRVKSGFGSRPLFATMAPGRLLDIPAGAGGESLMLIERGFDVVSLDLTPRGNEMNRLKWLCADANYPFPLRGGSFDYVLSREGIEHLENQTGFIQECARVIRPGGALIITTPNMTHLSARASLFLTGQRNLRRGLINEVQTPRANHGAHNYHGHVFMIDYFRLRYLMRLAGFEQLEVYTDRFSPTSMAMAWLAPFIYGACRFSVWTAERRARQKGHGSTPAAVTSEIIRHIMSGALLFGKRMIIVARRNQPAPR